MRICARRSTPARRASSTCTFRMLPQTVRYGFLGPVDWAVVEACDVTAGGGIVLTRRWAPRPPSQQRREGAHRAEPSPPAHAARHARHLPAARSAAAPRDPHLQRFGPHRLAAGDGGSRQDRGHRRNRPRRRSPSASTNRRRPPKPSAGTWPIFWLAEMRAGRMPRHFCRCNRASAISPTACWARWASIRDIPAFEMYTEVLQDAVVPPDRKRTLPFRLHLLAYAQPRGDAARHRQSAFFRPRILMRPQEISNNPEIVRRLGIDLHEHGHRGGPVRQRQLAPTSWAGR